MSQMPINSPTNATRRAVMGGASALAAGLTSASFAVRSVERKPYRRRPAAPFIASTFQQEAGRKLRLAWEAGCPTDALAAP